MRKPLLRSYWTIPERQIEELVVLADGRWAGLDAGVVAGRGLYDMSYDKRSRLTVKWKAL